MAEKLEELGLEGACYPRFFELLAFCVHSVSEEQVRRDNYNIRGIAPDAEEASSKLIVLICTGF